MHPLRMQLVFNNPLAYFMTATNERWVFSSASSSSRWLLLFTVYYCGVLEAAVVDRWVAVTHTNACVVPKNLPVCFFARSSASESQRCAFGEISLHLTASTGKHSSYSSACSKSGQIVFSLFHLWNAPKLIWIFHISTPFRCSLPSNNEKCSFERV